MAETRRQEVDSEQVKKAIQALLAYQKTKAGANSLLLNEHDRLSLMLTVWRIPKRDQTIKIPLPHGIRPESCEVCLFTKDEPNMTSEQTEKFYKKLLSQHGVAHISQIIPLKTLKKEYKPFEAKRRLLSSFDLFLSDDRIRRFLPSLLGKHFYRAKREPASVNLKTKYLAAELNRFIQGTKLKITNKGCCYAIRVGHTGMKVDDIVENTIAVAGVIAEKLPMKWKNVKLLHLKTQSSVALPIFNSALTNLNELEDANENQKPNQQRQEKGQKSAKRKSPKKDSGVTSDGSAPAEEETPPTGEEVPQLVPIHDTNTAKKGKAKLALTKTPVKKAKAGGRETGAAGSEKKMPPASARQKRKVNDSVKKEPETPIKQKRDAIAKSPKGGRRGQDSLPKGGILKKTPKKAAANSAVKLTKSPKPAPPTPKPKKKMKMPPSA